MIEEQVRQELVEIGRKVRMLFPNANGNVQINFSTDPKMEPKVNLSLADVTGAKAQDNRRKTQAAVDFWKGGVKK